MPNLKPLIFITILCAGSISAKAGIYTSTTNETVLQMAAYANLRHDSFGHSYTNIYGTANLAVDLNSVNDDRAVLEFPTYQIPTGNTITSATLTLYIDSAGNPGTFRLWGYNGDDVASMPDYYDEQVLLNTFTEGVPPTYGNISFNVTSFLQDQNSSGSQYSGFLFQAISQNFGVQFGGPGNPFPLPTLDVKYTTVPEPSAAALFLLGAALIKVKRSGCEKSLFRSSVKC